jgi:hypothetical protein
VIGNFRIDPYRGYIDTDAHAAFNGLRALEAQSVTNHFTDHHAIEFDEFHLRMSLDQYHSH